MRKSQKIKCKIVILAILTSIILGPMAFAEPFVPSPLDIEEAEQWE